MISLLFSECLLVIQSILNSRQPPKVEAEMSGLLCMAAQLVSDSKGAQATNLKLVPRGVPEGRWGVGNSPQAEGPEREAGREVGAGVREHLGYLVSESHLGFTDSARVICS